MKILLHICCGPCAIYPLQELRHQGHEVTGFFYNHNIHPYTEYQRRLVSVRDFAAAKELSMIYRDEYNLEEFLSAVARQPEQRCIYCYFSRMDAAARYAAENGFESFTSSLLYSRYQNHADIIAAGEKAGERYRINFQCQDFRAGWQEGIRISKEMGLYRQQYCGCIYSEKDRYLPPQTT